MSNQLQNKATALAEILAANKLTKTAEQKITHKSLLSQDDLGREMTREIHDNIDGVNADTDAASNDILPEEAQDIPGVQDLNRDASAAFKATGTTINTMNTDGNQVKSASLYRSRLASIMNEMDKQASFENNFVTGKETLRKLASLTPVSTEEDIDDARETLIKLAAYNPVFGDILEYTTMQKMAEDIAEVAAATGMDPEEAAAELQAAADANPEMLDEINDEASADAIEELAAAEDSAAAIDANIDDMAAGASEVLGTEVTPQDLSDAADIVQAMADEMGVPAEALVEEAAAEMLDGAGADEPTEEDLADAEEILAAAAEMGISPDEVLQIAAEDVAAAEDGCECGEPGCECEDDMPKEASCCGRKRRAGGRKVRKCAGMSPRAAYILSELGF